MVEFTTPLSIWMQLANFFFLLTGFYADLLLVRICLFSAYSWVFINACLGSPLWGSMINDGYFQLDMFVWASLNLWTFGTGIARLLLDEADVEMGSENLEALWRFLYRMGGVSRKLAKEYVMPHCTVVRAEPGQKLDTNKYFFIVYKGKVQVELHDWKTNEANVYEDGSGAIFDYKSLGLVNEDTFRATFHKIDTVVTCNTDCTMFRFPKETMRELASNPAIRNVWQTIFISQMARLVIMQRSDSNDYPVGLGMSIVRSTGCMCSLFLPLKDHELPVSTVSGSSMNMKSIANAIKHICHYARSGFYLPWPIHGHPIGIRHELVPPQNKFVEEESSTSTDASIAESKDDDIEAPANGA